MGWEEVGGIHGDGRLELLGMEEVGGLHGEMESWGWKRSAVPIWKKRHCDEGAPPSSCPPPTLLTPPPPGSLSPPAQEAALSLSELPDGVEEVAAAIRRQKDAATSAELSRRRAQMALRAGEGLQRDGNAYGARVGRAMDSLRRK